MRGTAVNRPAPAEIGNTGHCVGNLTTGELIGCTMALFIIQRQIESVHRSSLGQGLAKALDAKKFMEGNDILQQAPLPLWPQFWLLSSRFKECPYLLNSARDRKTVLQPRPKAVQPTDQPVAVVE